MKTNKKAKQGKAVSQGDTRTYQFEASKSEELFGYATVSSETFNDLYRDCEALAYCTKCEDAFAVGIDTEGVCYKCHGYKHAAHTDHAN